jgi:hypothetical protein
MEIYIVTYEESNAMEYHHRTTRIKAESLEQAYDKAHWGLGRKVINVREEGAEDRRELRREWIRTRGRYLATLDGQLKSIGFSDAEIAEIKERAKQRRKQRRSLERKIAKLRRLMRGLNFTDDEIKPYEGELRRKLTAQ